MDKKLAIGVLAFDVEEYIEDFVLSLLKLNKKIIVVDDCSSDKTPEILKKIADNNSQIEIITNPNNKGAGYSTRLLIEHSKSNEFDFLIKVDGDGQFIVSDVEKIINLYEQNGYEFIKGNRFWKGGIRGTIPKKRFIGNLLATIFMQLTTGTNKLFDPLNGLFGVSTKIIDELKEKNYPKRYGYPFFVTVSAVINEYKTFQINNVVIYDNQKSSISSYKMLFTIIRLSVSFFFKKIKIKKTIGYFQRSALLDISFVISLIFTFYLFFQLLYIGFFAQTSLIEAGNLLFILFLFVFISLLLFISSFREEKAIRNLYIDCE